MTGPRQHTIPRFYLDQFVAPGWVYRKGESEPRCVVNSKNVAVQPDYYGRAKIEGYSLDDYNTRIEELSAPSFRKLLQAPCSLGLGDWTALSYLFANLYVRAPVKIEEMRAIELRVAEWVNEIGRSFKERLVNAKDAGEDLSRFEGPALEPGCTGMTLDQWNEYFRRAQVQGGHRLLASGLFGAIPEIARCIQKMGFQLWDAPADMYFVTSDRPLRLVSLTTDSSVGVGWGNRDACGLVALNPTTYLCMCYSIPEREILLVKDTRDGVTFFNERTIADADHEVYSRDEYPHAEQWMKG